jgi:ADP-ribosylglycohydrolase
MLVQLAVGDAYGAAFEYAPPSVVATGNTVEGYGPERRGLAPGTYTDDTQMTIAIAEALVSGEPWTRENLADRFVAAFRRDPRAGYATRFHALLRELRDGADLLARIRPGSDKSGAAMRAGPVGLLPTVPEVLHHTDVQARITHDTPLGVEAAQAAALAVHYCHYDHGPVTDVAAWVDGRLGGTGRWSQPWTGPVGAQGWMSTRAALTALASSTSLREILRASVAFTGDVDTVATIALAAASCSRRVVDDLPAALYADLENGAYGRDFLDDLDARLFTWLGRARH